VRSIQSTDSRVVLVASQAFRPDRFLIWLRSAWPLTRRFAPTSPRERAGRGLRGASLQISIRKIQTATSLRSRAAARVGLLVDLPFLRGDGTPKGAPCNGRGLFPGLPRNRGTRQRLSASRRGVLKPWSALPGTWLPAISRAQPYVADPGSGVGRKPRASRGRGATMPVSCPGRGAASFMPLRRAGTAPNAGACCGPGSAAHHAVRATRCAASGERRW
jgi:hypothetical protein